MALVIDSKFKGECVTILLEAKNPDGSVIDDPAGQSVYASVAPTTADTETVITVDGVLDSESLGTFIIAMTAADLDTVEEGVEQAITIWSMLDPDCPQVQAHGKLTLRASVERNP